MTILFLWIWDPRSTAEPPVAPTPSIPLVLIAEVQAVFLENLYRLLYM